MPHERTTLALRPETLRWIRENASGPRSLGEVIDLLVQEKRVFMPLEQRVKALETSLAATAAPR